LGQIIKSLVSVCQSVCKHSYGRNFDSILVKFCTVIWGPKSKIEFVCYENLITPSPILPQFLLLARYILNVAKRGVYEIHVLLKTDRPTSVPERDFLEELQTDISL